MATVKGPLFSIGASGTIAGAVVYSTWKGRPYVRQHAVPANPRSAGQLSIRAMLAFLSQAWTHLSAVHQASWDTPAAATNISPFNAYMQVNLSRWGTGDGPSKDFPVEETPNTGSLDNHDVTAQSRALDVETECDVAAQMWGIAIYRGLEAGVAGARNELVHCVRNEALGVIHWLDFPLTVGVEQFYKFRPFSNDGRLGGLSAEVSGTPTA